GANRSHRTTQRLCRLLVRQSLDVDEQDGGSIVVGQLPKRRLDVRGRDGACGRRHLRGAGRRVRSKLVLVEGRQARIAAAALILVHAEGVRNREPPPPP